MDNLSYIALDRLDANLRRDLETGTIPIGHLLASSWTRRAALPSTPSLFERLWQYVGLPDQAASRSYRIETPQGSLMLIAETYRQGMLLSATGSPPNA